MTDEEEREIRLNISKQELLQLLGTLSESNLTVLAAKISLAWLNEPDEPEVETSNAQFAEGLQTVRARLFNLMGFLESTGYPRIALSWVEEAIEEVKSLQKMGE